MKAPRLYPGNPDADDDPDHIKAEIRRLAARHSRLYGHASTTALLASMARDNHLSSIPKAVRR